MKKEELKNKSIEKLESDLKVLQIIRWFTIGVSGVLFVVSLLGLIFRNTEIGMFLPLIVVALATMSMVPMNIKSIKIIEEEINLREKEKK